jgi:cytoskeletal protein CcmA (bactofilin family)
MDIKKNFKDVFNGLFSFAGAGSQTDGNNNGKNGLFPGLSKEPAAYVKSGEKTPRPTDAPSPIRAAPASVTASSIQTTVIAPGTFIEGAVSSDGHIEIKGRLKGDVKAKGNVHISGKVEGDIYCDCANLVSSEVAGDIHSETRVTLDNGSKLSGNVYASDLISDGVINGDLEIRNSVVLKKNTVLNGNISTKSLSVESGVVLNGTVEVQKERQT